MRPFYHVENYQSRRSIGFLVRRAANLLSAEVESAFAEQDITFVQWVVMMNLRDGLARNSTELCQNIQYDSGALTRVIDQLEHRGLVLRKRSTEDRRVISLSLTRAGRRTVDALLPLVISHYNTWLADFSAEEVEMLIALLTRLILAMPGGERIMG